MHAYANANFMTFFVFMSCLTLCVRYRERAQKMSATFRDRPLRPAERSAFWIEHIIKHGGDYMRSPVHELNIFQSHLIDVIALLTLIGVLTVYVMYKLLSFLVACCLSVFTCSSKKKKD